MQKDFVLRISQAQPNEPRVTLEVAEDGSACGMLTMVPDFDLDPGFYMCGQVDSFRQQKHVILSFTCRTDGNHFPRRLLGQHEWQSYSSRFSVIRVVVVLSRFDTY